MKWLGKPKLSPSSKTPSCRFGTGEAELEGRHGVAWAKPKDLPLCETYSELGLDYSAAR